MLEPAPGQACFFGGNVSLEHKTTILIVDDTPDNISLLCSLLGDRYRNKVATNGPKALKIAEATPHPDLILLDIMMPEMDGYKVCEALKANPKTRSIPVIFLTAKTQEADETKGFELGAVDYITKPISPPILLARVQTHLALQEARSRLSRQNEVLEEQVMERTRRLDNLQNAILVALASLAETRDDDTGQHVKRTQQYVRVLATAVAEHPKFNLSPAAIDTIYKTSSLHDIGKVGVPDSILLKPGPLTKEEFEEMKKHTILGRNTIMTAERSIDAPEEFLTVAREIATYHHERWDGRGYPEGLSGEKIPVPARIMAIADVYDALTSKRVYKDAIPHDKAVEIILSERGTHFDPDIVDAFIKNIDIFKQIAHEHGDD